MEDALLLCYENFAAFVRMIGHAPAGAFLRLADGTVAGASGLDSAGDSYALFARGATAKEAASIVGFFDGGGSSFMVPLFHKENAELKAELEARGMVNSCFHTAMALASAEKRSAFDLCVVKASSQSDISQWAAATWRGFGGAKEPDAKFCEFSRYMARCSENELYYLSEGGRAVCAGLLLKSERCVGLYYFATPPEYRRRGYARRLLSFMAQRAEGRLVLLATEDGRPVYESFGFEALSQIDMMRKGTE